MKRCPECRRDYFDDSLQYCLDDGERLLEGPASLEETPTAILSDPGTSHGGGGKGVRIYSNTSGDTAAQISPPHPAAKRYSIVAGALGVLIVAALGLGYYWLYGGRPVRIQSIAVIPFVNESGNTDFEYLSDGMTDALINNLSQLPQLSVKARSSVFRYKGKDVEPKQVASDLNVDAVLNGRVLQRADSVTLSLYLVDAASGDQIWGEQYIRKTSDLVALQNDIARDVASKLQRKLSGDDRRPAGYKTNTEAYQNYLKGLFHWNKRTKDDLQRAIQYFTAARDADPAFAQSYAGLALAYSVLPSNTLMPAPEARDTRIKARSAALRALELDPSLAEAHAVIAQSKIDQWDFAGSESDFRTAIELNPSFAAAHQWYAELLTRLGRHKEALAEINKAYELDPFSPAVNMNLGLRYADLDRIDEAIAQFKRTTEIEPGYPMAHLFLGFLYAELGRFDEAIDSIFRGDVLLGLQTPESAEQVKEHFRQRVAREGEKGFWRAALEYDIKLYEKGDSSEFSLACNYIRAGDRERAFEQLEKAYAKRDPQLSYIKAERALRPLRDDPRYIDLVKRVGLPL
jgi:TolB-like protein/Tfp pilus assembly protein PilF